MKKGGWNTECSLSKSSQGRLPCIRWVFLLLFAAACSTEAGSSAVSSRGAALTEGGGVDGSGDAAASSIAPSVQRTVWVVMKQKASLDVAHKAKTWKARGQAAFNALTENASKSQASLKAFLDARHIPYKSFWAVNALKLTADSATIDAISKRSDVARVVDDFRIALPPLEPSKKVPLIDTVEWNLTSIRAPESWVDFGTRGEGIVVANIDTGVQFDHPALVRQYRGTLADGSFDHNYNWYDPSNMCGNPSVEPCDNYGHGTHTMGTMVGDDGDRNQIGVAPEAKWIAAKGCEFYDCSYEALVSAGQWILAPTDLNGENPRPDLRPHIVNNSWGGGGGDAFYRDIVTAWVDAGIFPAFSVGNDGYGQCYTAGSPGDYPESYAAGAYDSDGYLAYFSALGPSYFDEIIKPNIAAPGVNIRSSVPGNDYAWSDGTSMASPHVAGTVALLWAAAPRLVGDISTTRALLDEGAFDREDESCGGDPADPGNNNVWGEGQLDAYAALYIAPIGPTGYLEGVVATVDGVPIPGASIGFVGAANRRTTSDENGAYRMRLPVGVYEVTFSAFGFLPLTEQDISIDEDVTVALNVALEPAPSYRVAGVLQNSDGESIEAATVTILDTPLPSIQTDDAGVFEFPSVPEGSYVLRLDAGGCYAVIETEIAVDSDLTLSFTAAAKFDAYGYRCKPIAFDFVAGDTPLQLYGDDDQVSVSLPFLFSFYGGSYDTVQVGTNGYISFATDAWDYYNTEIPSTTAPNGAVYAMWDDLYVDYDSTVSTAMSGEEPNRQFVIEWRDIYFLSNFDERATFEIILNESGEMLMQYLSAETGAMSQGGKATIGIENETGEVGLQYSYNETSVESGTAVMYEIPFAGFLSGTVTDANDGLPIADAQISAAAPGGRVVTSRTTSTGAYRLQVKEGDYIVSVAKKNYVSETSTVTVLEDETTTLDFALETPRAEVTPSTIQLVLPQGAIRDTALSLGNTGSAMLNFTIRESGGARQTLSVASAKRSRNLNANPNAYTTKDLYTDTVTTLNVQPDSPGDIMRSFTPVGLDLAWGIGQADNLWLSDALGMVNHAFTLDGEPTGMSWSTPWAGEWAADAAFDAARGLMCQLAVGGDNAIHCWDPNTGDVAEVISGTPWTNISQRGLAYKDSDDTFFVGGWNEGIVYHIMGLSYDTPGAVISSCSPRDGSISGLAYNDAMGVLWIATNSDMDTIYEVNPDDCTVLSELSPPQSGGYQGAGLEMDMDGNLWAVAQSPNTVYLVESGVPSFGDILWLSLTPESGSVEPGAAQMISVTIDTTGMAPGLYLGSIFIVTDAGKQPMLRVPVSLVISAYYEAVNSGGLTYVDSSGDTWARDQAYTAGDWGFVQRGKVRTTTHAISGTADPTLYQSQRENAYAYRYDNVPNGIYDVDFRFAELENVRIGRRLFDVIVENTTVLPAHDIQYEVGRFAADNQRFLIEVTDGRLDVRFVPRAGQKAPVINALRVVHRPDR